jgi:hypothetical protein
MGIFKSLFSPKPPESSSHRNEVVFLLGAGTYEVEVLGLENCQSALEAICGPRKPQGINRLETASLVWGDETPDDKDLVHVFIRGKRIGYLSREGRLLYAQQLRVRDLPHSNGRCQAMIRGGWISSDGRKGPYQVTLDIPNWS